MPWKKTSDPYKIWVSEIILQQTRVEQGRKYYDRFITSFPSVSALARASEDDVLAVWKGLGYYSRARNMHTSAKFILQHHSGHFPNTYEDILALKGVGPYTAAAIASFAYDLPFAVIDGNVYRVLSRIFAEKTPIDGTKGKLLFKEIAKKCLDEQQPGAYNQAIMDFGALQCKPKSPLCLACSLSQKCQAFQHKLVNDLPIKGKKTKVRKRFFNFLLFQKGQKYLVSKREENDIWKGLYQLPLIETEKEITMKKAQKLFSDKYALNNKTFATKLLYQKSQKLSHQLIYGSIYLISSGDPIVGLWKTRSEIMKLGLPKLLDQFFIEYDFEAIK